MDCKQLATLTQLCTILLHFATTIMGRIIFSILCLAGCLLATFAINEELVAKLDASASTTKKSIDDIFNEWQIDKYPNFLKSCFMSKMSWELMKLKFQKKILTALSKPAEKTKFVISFTGRYAV